MDHMVALRESERKRTYSPLLSLAACTPTVGNVNGHAWRLTPWSCCDMCAVIPAAWPLRWVIGEARKAVLQRRTGR